MTHNLPEWIIRDAVQRGLPIGNPSLTLAIKSDNRYRKALTNLSERFKYY